MEESFPHVPVSIGMGYRGIIKMVFGVVSVFFLKRKIKEKVTLYLEAW